MSTEAHTGRPRLFRRRHRDQPGLAGGHPITVQRLRPAYSNPEFLNTA